MDHSPQPFLSPWSRPMTTLEISDYPRGFKAIVEGLMMILNFVCHI